ncbi:hypothetical protein GALL_479310 [mine drainage metagenome]|uniref:Uncharacterized protein n=1 Tax=mine drainage metagenome TaxID=410659 RepID=A0A1J5PI50_9ZZZZ
MPAALEFVIARNTPCAVTTVQDVITSTAFQTIVPGHAHQSIVAVQPLKQIAAFISGQSFSRLRTRDRGGKTARQAIGCNNGRYMPDIEHLTPKIYALDCRLFTHKVVTNTQRLRNVAVQDDQQVIPITMKGKTFWFHIGGRFRISIIQINLVMRTTLIDDYVGTSAKVIDIVTQPAG